MVLDDLLLTCSGEDGCGAVKCPELFIVFDRGASGLGYGRLYFCLQRLTVYGREYFVGGVVVLLSTSREELSRKPKCSLRSSIFDKFVSSSFSVL